MKKSDFSSDKKALFIGNGINQLSDNSSWNQLLKDIIKENEIDVEIAKEKPNPLLFEEIIFKMLDKKPTSKDNYSDVIKKLKEKIAESSKKIIPNDFHSNAINLGINTILTTNYDYCFEKSINQTFEKDSQQKNTKEYKHSINRVNNLEDYNIWHIHGEIDNGFNGKGLQQYKSESIMIGNDQYADYLKKIIESVKEKSSNTFENDNLINSWTKLVLKYDIYFIGFGFDNSEYHLWWLLNYRAKLIKNNSKEIYNSIKYYTPCFNIAVDKNKYQLLSALGIEIVPIDGKYSAKCDKEDYKKFYEKAFKEINNGK